MPDPDARVMDHDWRGRHFLKLLDHDAASIRQLLALAADLKQAKRERQEARHLQGCNIALVFEKGSTRTRCAFEVAASDQGAGATYLGPSGSHIGAKETMADTARVLGRMYDAIAYRGHGQAVVEELAAHAGVPVYNALSDEWHPTQMLADLLTMQEHAGKPLERVSFAFLGDARSNVGNSLMVAGCLMGMDMRIGAPRANWPRDEFITEARRLAELSGGQLTLTEDPSQAVKGCDFVHTDVWVSMGEGEAVWEERIAALRPYQVNGTMMAATGNAQARFMHCLPAFHDNRTAIGREIEARFGLSAMEVTDEVFESPASIVFDQAENRMHTIKALLVATLAD